jgi:hypothetical protein
MPGAGASPRDQLGKKLCELSQFDRGSGDRHENRLRQRADLYKIGVVVAQKTEILGQLHPAQLSRARMHGEYLDCADRLLASLRGAFSALWGYPACPDAPKLLYGRRYEGYEPRCDAERQPQGIHDYGQWSARRWRGRDAGTG